MKWPLLYYGNPLLRERAEPIEEITLEVRQFCLDLVECMIAYDGIGLAAPQVGKLWRIFVSNILLEDEEGNVHTGEPKIFINPILTELSSVMIERSEGCVSIPKLYAPVIRPASVVIEYMDIDGKQHCEECQRYVARCYMHEYDHLDGILFVDRIKGKKRTEIEPKLREIRQKFHGK